MLHYIDRVDGHLIEVKNEQHLGVRYVWDQDLDTIAEVIVDDGDSYLFLYDEFVTIGADLDWFQARHPNLPIVRRKSAGGNIMLVMRQAKEKKHGFPN